MAGARAEQTTRPLARLLTWALRAEALPPVRLARGDWLAIGSVFVLSRLALITLALAGASFFPALNPDGTFTLHPIFGPNGSGDWGRVFAQFDSGWYLGISGGYPLPGSGPDWLRMWAYFPGYPFVVHLVELFLRALRYPGNAQVLGGVLVSHAALFGGLVYLYRLVAGEVSPRVARRTLVYLVAFPASFFFSAIYSESLFLFLSTAAFYHARRRQWAAAGLLCAATLLTRPQGLLLLVPLGLEFLAEARRSELPWTRRLLPGLWLGAPLVALGAYALYSRAQTGYWLAFATSAREAWGHRLTPPPYPLVMYLLHPSLGDALSFDFISANFLAAVLFFVLSYVALRRLPPAYGVWLLLGTLFSLSSNGRHLFSLVRYLLPLFPAFVALALWSLGQRWTPTGIHDEQLTAPTCELRDRLVLYPSLLLLAVYVLMFMNAYPAAI